jgi:branched-subunit amino acid aminotransferase/4-amino-4-deoxychorismate lyase
MLDVDGYVAETNATNLFLVKRDRLITPLSDSCLPGITRGVVLEITREAGIDTVERRVTPSELYTADECFTTGTMGELAPALEIDGRKVGDGDIGPMTRKLQQLYSTRTAREGTPLPPG